MDDLLRQWDGESVILRLDRATNSWIIIAIHSTRLGPATGGTRMKSYSDLRAATKDALRLASSMTLKFAVCGFPAGGGKAVIAIPENLNSTARVELLHRYGYLIHQLGGLYRTGPDVGTTPEDMDIIAETGAPYVFSRTTSAGGAGSSAPPTALGVFHAIQMVSERLSGDRSLTGKRILVQGIGGVGESLIERLHDAGAHVMFSEVDAGTIRLWRDERGFEFVRADQVYQTECDIFAPCALGGIFNEDTIPRLRCRGIAGAANNQLVSPANAKELRARQILYAPDFVVNIGGAMAITGIELYGWSWELANRRVIETVERTLRAVFDRAEVEGITTDSAARLLAAESLAST